MAVNPVDVNAENVNAENVSSENVSPENVSPEAVSPEAVSPETVGPEAVSSAAVNAPGDVTDSRLSVIEELPLAERAAAYAQLYDQLRDRLEGGDVPLPNNG